MANIVRAQMLAPDCSSLTSAAEALRNPLRSGLVFWISLMPDA